jgi:hypothetical protein
MVALAKILGEGGASASYREQRLLPIHGFPLQRNVCMNADVLLERQ